jgi:SAM-dependent methyltransferase
VRPALAGRAPGDSRPPAFSPIAQELRDEIIEHYERRGERLDTPAGRRTLDTNSTLAARRGRLLLRLLAEQGAPSVAGRGLLDLGAGFGALSLYFAHLGAEVVAVDPNTARMEVAVAIAARRGLPVRAVSAHAERLPLPEDSVDVVVANNSLCYIVRPDAQRLALAEILRVLRAGGWLVARSPNRLHPRDQFTGLPLLGLLPPSLAARAAATLGRHRSAVHLRSPGGMVRQLRSAGFSQVGFRAPAGDRRGFPASAASRLSGYHHVIARRPDGAATATPGARASAR